MAYGLGTPDFCSQVSLKRMFGHRPIVGRRSQGVGVEHPTTRRCISKDADVPRSTEQPYDQDNDKNNSEYAPIP